MKSLAPFLFVLVLCPGLPFPVSPSSPFQVEEDEEEIRISGDRLEAVVRKRGYVSGISRGSFLDRASGFRDAGFGLSIADFILESGSDETYRDQLPPEMVYHFNTPVHGRTAKRKIEGPQICTRALELAPLLIRGADFLAVRLQYRFPLAAPGRRPGSTWTQTLLFLPGKRYYLCSQGIESVNESPALFFRIDMPGHIRHQRGDTFSEIYLSYLPWTNTPGAPGHFTIPSREFFEDFPPDEKFNYRRDRAPSLPSRFIRAYRLRDPQTGREGPWLAGMTLEPATVYEAWCHQRGYVCLIEEFGGYPVSAGESFGAAFLVGFFDSIEEMEQVYDEYAGATGLQVDESGWRLTREPVRAPATAGGGGGSGSSPVR